MKMAALSARMLILKGLSKQSVAMKAWLLQYPQSKTWGRKIKITTKSSQEIFNTSKQRVGTGSVGQMAIRLFYGFWIKKKSEEVVILKLGRRKNNLEVRRQKRTKYPTALPRTNEKENHQQAYCKPYILSCFSSVSISPQINQDSGQVHQQDRWSLWQVPFLFFVIVPNSVQITLTKPPPCPCLDILMHPQIKPLVHGPHILASQPAWLSPLPLSLCSFHMFSSCHVMTLFPYIGTNNTK